MSEDSNESPVAPAKRGVPRGLIVLVIVAALFGLLAAKTLSDRPSESDPAGVSTYRGDPVSAYEEALAGDKPIYVLFHSLTCDPCIQISAVVDQVVPEYADSVTFVNVITDDPGGQELASRFEFQYIPTSFFISSDGEVADSFTGVLNAEDLRSRLDALVASR